MTKLTQTLILLFFASISSCGTAIKPIDLSEEGVMYLVKPNLINEDEEVLCVAHGLQVASEKGTQSPKPPARNLL